MGLYLGSNKHILNFNGSVHRFNVHHSLVQLLNGVMLLSSENYILKDHNGLYLTAKEDK